MSLSLSIEESLSGLESFADEILLIEAEAFANILDAEIKRLRASRIDEDEIARILQADFDSKGRIFGQAETAVKARVAGLISAASHGAEEAVYRDAGIVSDQRRWITVNINLPKKVCPDCPTRNGQVESIETWRRIGKPGSGWSVCGPWDYCILVPANIDMPSIIDVVRLAA